MFASISSAVLIGAVGQPITVEVHVGQGLPSFNIVGLPDESIREARDRVRAAVMSSDQQWPRHRVTIGLAPSQERKTGSGLDLAIAVGVLVATGVIDVATRSRGLAFIGELGLDGSIRPVRGVAPMVGMLGDIRRRRAGRFGRRGASRRRSARCGSCATWPRSSTCSLTTDRRGPTTNRRRACAPQPSCPTCRRCTDNRSPAWGWRSPPRAVTTRSSSARRAPARRCWRRVCPGLLPPLERGRGARGHDGPFGGWRCRCHRSGLIERPPFRAPHHTSSMVSVIGGGSQYPRPGEVSLAHCGVLFIDEIAEFPAIDPRLAAPTARGRCGPGRPSEGRASICRPISCSWRR